MKINDAVLQRLDSNKGLGLIMRALDVSHSTARAYIKANDDNLTKAAMLEAIREEYGLTDEEILVRELPEAAQS